MTDGGNVASGKRFSRKRREYARAPRALSDPDSALEIVVVYFFD